MTSKQIAIVELGQSKVLCPVAKISALLAILENCQIVERVSLRENYRSEVDDNGQPVCDYVDALVEAADGVTVKIEESKKVMSRDDYNKRSTESYARADELETAAKASHPYRFKVTGAEYFGSYRYRTLHECIEAGTANSRGKKLGFTIYLGDEVEATIEPIEVE